MENSEKIDFDKLTVDNIGELDLYRLTDEEFIKVYNVFNNNQSKLDLGELLRLSAYLISHEVTRYYTTPLKEEITKLKQENEKLKEDIKELKSQNQTLQNSFNQLLGILSQQHPELKNQLQGLSGASGDMSELTSKDKGYTFSTHN